MANIDATSEPVALISDIHGNLEALEVVLADIAARGIKRIVCLGDVVGYGPDPVACTDLALTFDVLLEGNHEEALRCGPTLMNGPAKQAIIWTGEQLRPSRQSDPQTRQRWELLTNLVLTYAEDDALFVHGSPREPTVEYILRQDTHDLFGEVPEKIRKIFDCMPRLCFVGHTHSPGIITEESQFLAPEDFGMRYTLGRTNRFICNVGSVGQPRDGDHRSCYAIYEGTLLTYVRLEYPYDVTAEKIRAIPELDDRLADRLGVGK